MVTGEAHRGRAAIEHVLPVLREHAGQLDETAGFPEHGMRSLRDSGLLGLLVPERYGGLGGDLADLVDGAQRLATGCLSTAVIWAMHCPQVDALGRFARPPPWGRALP